MITPFVGVIEACLPDDITLKGSVIHERLVAEHGEAKRIGSSSFMARWNQA